MAKKKSNNRKRKVFIRPDDPFWNPDDEQDYRDAYGDEEDERESNEPPMVNEIFLQSFIEEWQPEQNEHLEGVRALSMGELRDALQIYRTFDSRQSDPLPAYLAALANHGFGIRVGFSRELVMLVSRRNNGRGVKVEGNILH